MHDRPPPEALIGAVRRALDEGALDATFARKVAANALAIAERELTLGPDQAEAEHSRLAGLVEPGRDLADANRALAGSIRSGAPLGPDLLAHLIATTIAKLEVDQPSYPAFRLWRDGKG